MRRSLGRHLPGRARPAERNRLERRRSDATAEWRLTPARYARLTQVMWTAGVLPDGHSGRELEGRLHELSALYEPYLAGLADRLMMPLPAWAPEPDGLDDWQTTADGVTAPSVAVLTSGRG